MTAVVFYHVKVPQPQSKARLTCQLAAKAYERGHTVYINTQNEAQSSMLNQLLWTFAPNSFVPHALLMDHLEPDLDKYPVIIGHENPPEQFNDVLISLHEEVPAYVSRFQRVIEPVDADSRDETKAKSKFSNYQSLFNTEPKAYYV